MGSDNRPLDLEWLEDFLALAETGNFSRAAEARVIASRRSRATSARSSSGSASTWSTAARIRSS
jgi:hypothetical protein